MGVRTISDLAIELHVLIVGPLDVNAYIVIDPATRHAAIIDPGAEAVRILAKANALNARPALILNTHTHGDHIGGNEAIKTATMAPLALHPLEADWLADPQANLSALFGNPVVSPPAEILIEHGDCLRIGELEIHVRHTPGHSPGSTSFLINSTLFCGDTLFREGIGRTDLPGGDPDRLIESIRKEILTLPDETTLCPGHGPMTTVKHERMKNPFLS